MTDVLAQTIRIALDTAGYTESPATVDKLKECFLDYVAAGYWSNMDYVEAQEELKEGFITTGMICAALVGPKWPELFKTEKFFCALAN